MSSDAIQMRTKNLKSMIKIAVNFNVLLSVSDMKIIGERQPFLWLQNSNFSLNFQELFCWFFTRSLWFFHMNFQIFWPIFSYQKLFWKIIYFYRYSKKFIHKISSVFLNQGSQGNFPDKYVSGGQFWKKCPTGYRACYFSTDYLNAIFVLKSYIPKNRNIFSSVQNAERIFKFRSEFRQNCGWTFSFQCAIMDLQKNSTARKKRKQSRSERKKWSYEKSNNRCWKGIWVQNRWHYLLCTHVF